MEVLERARGDSDNVAVTSRCDHLKTNGSPVDLSLCD